MRTEKDSDRWADRLDRFLAPRLDAATADLEDVDRMDWELWLLVVLVLLMLALAFLLNHFPELIGTSRNRPMAPELETYLDGFAVIVLFFTLYVIQKHRQLVETRRRLMRSRIDQMALNHRLEIIEVLFGVSTAVTSRAGTERSFDDVLDHLREIMGGERAVLWGKEGETGELVLRSFRGDGERPPAGAAGGAPAGRVRGSGRARRAVSLGGGTCLRGLRPPRGRRRAPGGPRRHHHKGGPPVLRP